MNSLKKFFKGKSCGCSSSTRKHKRNIKRRYRGGFTYNKSKSGNKTQSQKGDVIFSSNSKRNSSRRRNTKKTHTH